MTQPLLTQLVTQPLLTQLMTQLRTQALLTQLPQGPQGPGGGVPGTPQSLQGSHREVCPPPEPPARRLTRSWPVRGRFAAAFIFV